MPQNQRGISLLEVLLASVMFGILTLGTWSAFQKVYWNYTEAQMRAQLQEEVRTISAFIKEELRMSEVVVVRYGDKAGKDIMQETETIIGQELHSIQFWPDRMVGTNRDTMYFVFNPNVGFFELTYQGNVLSNWIKKLTVSRLKDSDLITLNLVVGHPKRDIQQEETILISLQYKK